MSERLKTLSETAFNVTKIVAVIVAGAWTYYQWDRVIFPEESAKQDARAALDRVDISLGFSDLSITSLGVPAELAGQAVEVVELSGVIELNNDRSYPVQVIPKSTTVRLGHGLDYAAGKGLSPVAMAEQVEVMLPASDAFGEHLDAEGLLLENGGSATLAFNLPFFVDDTQSRATKEYVFFAAFQLLALNQNTGAATEENTKIKSAYARILDVAVAPVPTSAARAAIPRQPRPARETPISGSRPKRTIRRATGTGVFR